MIEISRLKQQKDDSDMAKWVTDKRLYLSEDGLTVVDEAALGRKTLLAPAGSQVTDAVCRRYGLGPYAEQTAISGDNSGSGQGDDEATDPETAGSCCSHVFRVHRKEDGLCSQRRHCGCQGWQPQQAGEDDPEGGDSGQDPEGGASNQDVQSTDTSEPGGEPNAQDPAV